MIVLNVYYNCKPGKREEFYKAADERAQFFRTEKGNIQYAYFKSVADENLLLLVEKWADEESLAAHASTDVFKSLGKVKAELVDDVQIMKFFVE